LASRSGFCLFCSQVGECVCNGKKSIAADDQAGNPLDALEDEGFVLVHGKAKSGVNALGWIKRQVGTDTLAGHQFGEDATEALASIRVDAGTRAPP